MTSYETETWGGFRSLIETMDEEDSTNGNVFLSRAEIENFTDDLESKAIGVNNSYRNRNYMKQGTLPGGAYADTEFATMLEQTAENPDNEIDNWSRSMWMDRIYPDTGQPTGLDIGPNPPDYKSLKISQNSIPMIREAHRSYNAELTKYVSRPFSTSQDQIPTTYRIPERDDKQTPYSVVDEQKKKRAR